MPSTGAGSSVRARQPGVAQVGRCLAHIGMVVDRRTFGQCLVGSQLGLRRGQGGTGLGHACLGILEGGFGVQDFLAADAARSRQGLAALQVALGALEIGFGTSNIGPAHLDIGGQAVILDIQGAYLTYRLGETGFGLGQRNIGVGRVQANQGLAGLDQVGVVGLDGDHSAGHLGSDLHQVAMDVGIIGALEVCAEQHPPEGIGQSQHQEYAAGDQ